MSGENISSNRIFTSHQTPHHHSFHIIRQVAPNMNLTEAPSNLLDLDPEPAPEPSATNNESTTISIFEHPANSTEKTSWARCMLTDDVEVSSCEREFKRQKQQILTITSHTHQTHHATIRQDGSHLNLTGVITNIPDTAFLTLRRELETTAASGNEHSESNAMFDRYLLCLSIALTTAGMMTTLSSNKARSCFCFCLERLSRAHSSMRTRMKKARQFEKSRESRGWSLICYIEDIFLALISFWSLTIAIL